MAKIIHLVGTSNSGKSTIHPQLNELLRKDNCNVEELREPGPLRDLAKNYRTRKDKNSYTETAIFTTDRFMLYSERVLPRMNEENLIFSFDRGLPDTIVYQGLMGRVPIDLILKMNSHIPQSDLYLVLFVDGSEGYQRALKKQKETGEAPSQNETAESINKLAAFYKTLSQHLPNVKLIDTSRKEISDVLNECYTHAKQVYK
jgi:thymidylate kinase